ncbi:hypothetical protein ACWFRJ_33660 [Streptomyces sp. NPDC055239]
MDVLWQLQGEPTHATRERYSADRERLVRQPMIALLNEVADADPRYQVFSVWHYRTNSWWYPDPSQMDMFRKAVASEASGRELSAILEDVQKKGDAGAGPRRPATRRGPDQRGPDPLHRAEMFGLDEKTAMRNSGSARALK